MTYDSILLSAVAIVSTLTGGLAAVRLRDRLGVVTAFASGVLIAVLLFDLLPGSLALAPAAGVLIRRVMYATAVGFVSLHSFVDGFAIGTGFHVSFQVGAVVAVAVSAVTTMPRLRRHGFGTS
jgi:zinc transporter ZupT